MHPRIGEIFFALVASLALLFGNVHCTSPTTVPRLVLSGRMSLVESSHGRRADHAAMASLTLPLDTAHPQALDQDALLEQALDARERLTVDPRVLDARTTEPSIESLVQAALASRRFDPSRATDARDRARLSGLLPQVRVGLRRGTGWDLRTQQTNTSDSAVLANDDSWSIVGTATFRLDRLLYAREENQLFAEERRLEELRLQLVREIVHAYYERLALLWAEREGPSQPERIMEIAELGAMLDIWTDGAFSAPR